MVDTKQLPTPSGADPFEAEILEKLCLAPYGGFPKIEGAISGSTQKGV